jgi:hypothetical protein
MEMLAQLAQDEKMPEEDATLFGIWVVSASIQLQLKADHKPFTVSRARFRPKHCTLEERLRVSRLTPLEALPCV